MSSWLKIAIGEPSKTINESELEEQILKPEIKISNFEPEIRISSDILSDDNYPSLMINKPVNKLKIIKKNKKENTDTNKDTSKDIKDIKDTSKDIKDNNIDKEINNFKENKINEIDEIIKTHCVNKALELSKQIYNIYESINPIEANSIADKHYHTTYNTLYPLLLKKYKNVTDNIINSIDNIPFDNISVVKSTKSSVTKSFSESSNSVIITSIKSTESVIIKSGEVSEDEDFIKEEVTEEVTEEYNNTNNNNTNSVITQEFNEWTKVTSNKFDKPDKFDKINPLKKYANDLASKLIKDGNDIKNNNTIKNNNPIIFQIKINCKNQILGNIDNKKIYPNKFLDPTYINTTAQIHSPSHRLFKREFFEVLNNRIGENHNIHARFDKDYDDSNIFYIRFFKRRVKEEDNHTNWIS
jgi:hypothetical protein